MSFSVRFARLALLALLPLALLTAGCEDSVDPFIDSDKYYTLYGYLDTGSDTQYVRVVPLRQSLDVEAEADPLDATVTITELETGYVYPLRDSLIRFSNGRHGHVFYTVFHPAPTRSYRLDVRRSDGVGSSAETRVPAFQFATLHPAQGLGTGYIQNIDWEGIDFQPFAIEVWYRFGRITPGPFNDQVVFYPPGRLQDGSLRVTVRYSDDAEEIRSRLGQSVQQMPLLGMGMRLVQPDSAWRPPGGVFDPEILVQPGTFSNVENGFGFFGSANRYTVEWVLSPEVTEGIGFRAPD